MKTIVKLRFVIKQLIRVIVFRNLNSVGINVVV